MNFPACPSGQPVAELTKIVGPGDLVVRATVQDNTGDQVMGGALGREDGIYPPGFHEAVGVKEGDNGGLGNLKGHVAGRAAKEPGC